MLYAKIVPKSTMCDAIQGDTFDITLTKGYCAEAKEEAKLLEAKRVLRMIRNKKIVPQSLNLPKGGYSRVAVDHTRLWDAVQAACHQ